ncbi:hypothetical protein Tco_0918383 [Tanacetum coccineum]
MNSTNLTELLTVVKTFDFHGLKSTIDSLKVIVDAQNDHLVIWDKFSASLAWSVQQLLGESSAHTATITPTEETPSYTEGKKADMETEEKEPNVENLTDTVIDITPLEQPKTQHTTPKPDRRKGKVTNDVESPPKLVKALSKAHLDKEEKLENAKREAKLLVMNKSGLIKFVHDEAAKAGVDPKILASAKGDQKFRKIQEAEIKVLVVLVVGYFLLDPTSIDRIP